MVEVRLTIVIGFYNARWKHVLTQNINEFLDVVMETEPVMGGFINPNHQGTF